MQIDTKIEMTHRALFPSGAQKIFLEQAALRFPGGCEDVATFCGVHPRTLRDWRREKYTMSASALDVICKRAGLDPGEIRLIGSYDHVARAGSKGARSRNLLYGNPGTAEGRRKGGRNSQALFRSNIEYFRRIGVTVLKPVTEPLPSKRLAEFVGVLLGDGSISNYQVSAYFNARTEENLGRLVRNDIFELFGISATLSHRKRNLLAIIASGKRLVELLGKFGLPPGDKIRNRVGVPKWIFEDRHFMEGCLRGLIDTDGCIYFHRHTSRGHMYRHIGLSFTSYSSILLRDVQRLFTELGFRSKIYSKTGHIFLFRQGEVRDYMDFIGTRNPFHLRQFKSYFSQH